LLTLTNRFRPSPAGAAQTMEEADTNATLAQAVAPMRAVVAAAKLEPENWTAKAPPEGPVEGEMDETSGAGGGVSRGGGGCT
jgi:hypothetical protein